VEHTASAVEVQAETVVCQALHTVQAVQEAAFVVPVLKVPAAHVVQTRLAVEPEDIQPVAN
jgi:hypothetical protein